MTSIWEHDSLTLRVDEDDTTSDDCSAGPPLKVWKQLSSSISQKSNRLKKILKEAKELPHFPRKVWLTFMNFGKWLIG